MDVPPQGAFQAGSPVEAPVDETLSRGLVEQPSNPVKRNGVGEREENTIIVYENSVSQELPQNNTRALNSKHLIDAVSTSDYPGKLPQEFDNIRKTSDAGSISNTFLAEPFTIGANSQPECPCNEENLSKYTSEQESCSEHGMGEVKESVADRMDCGCLSQKRSPSCWCSIKYTNSSDQLVGPNLSIETNISSSFSILPEYLERDAIRTRQYENSRSVNLFVDEVRIKYEDSYSTEINTSDVSTSLFSNSKDVLSQKEDRSKPTTQHPSIPKRIQIQQRMLNSITSSNSFRKLTKDMYVIPPPNFEPLGTYSEPKLSLSYATGPFNYKASIPLDILPSVELKSQNFDPDIYIEQATQVNVWTTTPCVLAGRGVASSDELSPQIYGTDLGFVTYFNGKSYIFFGDTWIWEPWNSDKISSTPCGKPGCNNDAIGYTTEQPNPTGKECPEITFFKQGKSFAPISTIPVAPLGDLNTPVGAFSTSKYLYMGVLLQRTTNQIPNSEPVVSIYIVKNDGKSNVFQGIAPVLYFDHSEELVDLGVDIVSVFSNVAFTVKKSLQVKDIVNPVFVFGRASFVKYKDPSLAHLTNVYLMVLDADELDARNSLSFEPLKRYYYLGNEKDENGNEVPIWGSGEDVNLHPIVLGSEDVTYINQMSVIYNSEMDLWVMLYGGGVFDVLKSEETEEDFDFNSSDAGVYVRMSSQPWGPWSKQVLLYDFKKPDCRTLFVPPSIFDYNPQICTSPLLGPTGEILIGATCKSSCVGPDDMSPVIGNVPLDDQIVEGVPYGASFWDGKFYPFKFEKYDGITFYFTMSTWNPYHVVLMKASLGVVK